MSDLDPRLSDFLSGRQQVVMTKRNADWFYRQQRTALIRITPIDIHTAWVELTETGKEFARAEKT
jgi:hypothetical protein